MCQISVNSGHFNIGTNFGLTGRKLPLFIHKGLGTCQFVSHDKNFLATIFFMKTNPVLRPLSNATEPTIY